MVFSDSLSPACISNILRSMNSASQKASSLSRFSDSLPVFSYSALNFKALSLMDNCVWFGGIGET